MYVYVKACDSSLMTKEAMHLKESKEQIREGSKRGK